MRVAVSEINLVAAEFDDYRIGIDASITFCLKELRVSCWVVIAVTWMVRRRWVVITIRMVGGDSCEDEVGGDSCEEDGCNRCVHFLFAAVFRLFCFLPRLSTMPCP